jgi:HTH-type transcriptional regulator/antitoxin HigA
MTAVTTEHERQASAAFLGVVAATGFPPRAIHTDAQLDAAISVMDRFLEQEALSSAERDYLDTLSTLVEAYEREHIPMPAVSGVAVLRHLMEANGLRQADLLDIFPTRSVVSEILSGRRQLTLDHMRGLSRRFGVPVDLFIS